MDVYDMLESLNRIVSEQAETIERQVEEIAALKAKLRPNSLADLLRREDLVRLKLEFEIRAER